METLLPGCEVRARGLRWEVVRSQRLGGQTLYELRGLDGAFHGEVCEVLAPFEELQAVQRDFDLTRAAPLAQWRILHEAFLLEQALGPNALLAAQPGRLTIEPYQLVPVMRALKQSRVRLLLADDVGLGKTIQAGLILTELTARRLAHRVLIVCPPGPLLLQWHDEMRDRFGMRFRILDREALDEIRRENELGANPFDFVAHALASVDFLKQDRILEELQRSAFDLVIFDEAHHATDAGPSADAEDSQRRRLATVLSECSDALLLLTATPHDGNDRSLALLCELLDPSLVDRRGGLRGDKYRSFVVRRLKAHIKNDDGTDRFKRRNVVPVRVAAKPGRHDAFVAFERALLAFVLPALKRARRSRDYASFLSYFVLLKRSVSSVAAAYETMKRLHARIDEILRAGIEDREAKRELLSSRRALERKFERRGVLSEEEERAAHDLDVEILASEIIEGSAGAKDAARRIEADVRKSGREVRKQGELLDAVADLLELAAAALAAPDPRSEGRRGPRERAILPRRVPNQLRQSAGGSPVRKSASFHTRRPSAVGRLVGQNAPRSAVNPPEEVNPGPPPVAAERPRR